jgi:prephenate dehydratase
LLRLPIAPTFIATVGPTVAAYHRRVHAITFFGPEGTFAEEALLSQPDLAAMARTPQRSVPDVIASVARGEFVVGVVPIENMIEGSVSVTLDALAFESDLLIQREVDLPISLSFCTRPGVHLADVKSVLSFPIAAAQCRSWLARKVPNANFQAANSTADAAREVAASKRALGAICNPLAAKRYSLRVVARDIEDHPENQTRFVVVGRGVPAATGHDKTSIVVFQRADRPGSLLGILQEFAARSINLTKLESRPTKKSLGDYCFFIDLDGHISDELLADSLRTIAAKQALVKFLGSYPVGGPQEAGVVRRRAANRAWHDASSWIDEIRAQIRSSAGLPEAGA